MISFFVVSSLLCFYIIAGWPLLLGLWAILFRKPFRRKFSERTVTVIIAVHNGEKYLRAKLESVFLLNYPQELIEVIVVSDGSTDATDEIAESFSRVHLMRVPKGGKSAALSAAIPHATGEILFLTDVRQELDANCLRELICCFADDNIGAVSGQLIIRTDEGVRNRGSQDVGLYWKLETWVRYRLSEIDSMFGATGPVYALRRSLAVPIPGEILLDDMYLPLAGFFRGYRLVCCASAIAWDYPTTRHTEFGRKARTLAGNYQLLGYYPQLLVPFVNRMWFHYMSYKFGRIVVPWALLASFVSAFWLPDPWRWMLPLGGVLMIVCALLDESIPQGVFLKRVTSLVRTFLVMMAAAIVALRVYFVDPRSMWTVTKPKKEFLK